MASNLDPMLNVCSKEHERDRDSKPEETRNNHLTKWHRQTGLLGNRQEIHDTKDGKCDKRQYKRRRQDSLLPILALERLVNPRHTVFQQLHPRAVHNEGPHGERATP